jgi:uncharacterized protein
MQHEKSSDKQKRSMVASFGVGMLVGGVVLWRRAVAQPPQPAVFQAMRVSEPGTALITGASSGIGAAYARRLAVEGYDLILVARREERLQALADKLNKQHHVAAEALVADLSNAEDVARVEARIAACDTLSVLVNNAGFGTAGHFADIDVQKQLDMIHVHVIASVRLSRAALPGMLARKRGAIVNVSSIAAFFPAPGNASYCATKRYLNAFSEALDKEVADQGVQVQALCPGFTTTEFHDTSEYETFDRGKVPSYLWMSSREVVTRSVAALERGTVIVVPGVQNKILLAIIHSPLAQLLLRLRQGLRRP